jgi:hypothetical protein
VLGSAGKQEGRQAWQDKKPLLLAAHLVLVLQQIVAL